MDAVHYAVIVCRSDNNIMIGVRAREKFLLHQQQQHTHGQKEKTPRDDHATCSRDLHLNHNLICGLLIKISRVLGCILFRLFGN